MKPVVAIVAAGSMGAGIARRLSEHDIKVLTALEGRSPATRRRAAAAGMTEVPSEALVEADLLLSVLPPGEALSFAERTAFALKAVRRKPLFVDCNAVSPATVRHIQAVIAATGTDFADACILGYPPVPGGDGPRIYVSGEHASRLQLLGRYGLDVRLLRGPVGAASALKMTFAGISKGSTAVVAAMVLAATRSGTADALRRELSENDPQLFAAMSKRVPAMFTKAWRWVAEMEEIAEFAREDRAARDIWMGMSRLYERLAADVATDGAEKAALTAFFGARAEGRRAAGRTKRSSGPAARQSAAKPGAGPSRKAPGSGRLPRPGKPR